MLVVHGRCQSSTGDVSRSREMLFTHGTNESFTGDRSRADDLALADVRCYGSLRKEKLPGPFYDSYYDSGATGLGVIIGCYNWE